MKSECELQNGGAVTSKDGLGDEKRGTFDPKYIHRCYECGKPLNGAEFCPDCEGSTLRDTQRMDWLESNNHKLEIRIATNEKPHPVVCLSVGDDKPEYTGPNVRCAIDAAMKSPNAEVRQAAGQNEMWGKAAPNLASAIERIV